MSEDAGITYAETICKMQQIWPDSYAIGIIGATISSDIFQWI